MPKFFKMFTRVIARLILCGTTALMTVFAVGVYAQALIEHQKLSTLDYCAPIKRLLKPEEKVSGSKALDVAVTLCEAYMAVDVKDCVEKDQSLDTVVAQLNQKPRTEYGLTQALTDLAALSVRLGADGGCTSVPKPQTRVGPEEIYHKRK